MKEKVSFENTTSYRDIIESVRIELKTKDDNNFNLFHSKLMRIITILILLKKKKRIYLKKKEMMKILIRFQIKGKII